MIPTHLQGKNAIQIVDELEKKWWMFEHDTPEVDYKNFIRHLEGLLLLAVGDALCNCDKHMRVQELIAGNTDGPGDRAIVFLNTVLPKE